MNHPESVQRYEGLIRATIRTALASRRSFREPASGLSLDVCLPQLARAVGESFDPSLAAELESHLCSRRTSSRVVDGGGHSRPMYRGLLARYAAAPVDRQLTLPPVINAETAGDVIAVAFDALWIDQGTSVFESLARTQQPDGTFFARTSRDNPEPLWYCEMAMLHAMGLVAHRSPRLAAATARSTTYVAAEIQPDHASSHPLAIGPLVLDAGGVFLADMMLHAAGVQSPAGMDAASLLLLGDALESFRLSR